MLLEEYGSTLDEVTKVSVTCNVEVLRFVMIPSLYMHKRVVISKTQTLPVAATFYIMYTGYKTGHMHPQTHNQ